MSRPTDPLRDKIAKYLDSYVARRGRGHLVFPEGADAILAIVRAHATSDAAVDTAHAAYMVEKSASNSREGVIAAITAALGGEP